MNPKANHTHQWRQGPLAIAVLALLAVPAVYAQQEGPVEERPSFEAATIKPSAPDLPPSARNRVMPTAPNRLSIPSMPLSWLIYTAYGDGGFNTSMRVTGGPDWINSTAFAVEGVAADRATPGELRLMLQRLLEERFALKLRVEMSSVDLLALVVDRRDGTLGPKVRAWDGTCQFGAPSAEDDPARPRCPSGYRAGGILLDGATMFSVAETLSLPQSRALLGTIVDDQTGLTGRYTLELDYPFAAPRPADPGTRPAPGVPSLFTAVQEQWGLRVVPGQGPFRLVVVEIAQLPAAD